MQIKTTLVVTALIITMAIFPSSSVMADDSPKVTIQNYVRAETDLQMRTYVENMDAFGKFAHVREAYVRMYQPQKEILEGTWKFPVPVTP